MELVRVEYHADKVKKEKEVELMPHTLTFDDGSQYTRFGIVHLPLDKNMGDIVSLLKELVSNGDHYSVQSHDVKEIKCCYRAGFRAFRVDEDTKMTTEQEHVDFLNTYTSIYMEINPKEWE